MINKKLFWVFGFLILLVGSIGFVSAQFTSSTYSSQSFSGGNRGTAGFVNYGAPSDFQSYYRGEGRLNTYFPILKDPESCFARQDLILQVAPAGCEPSVVRSDLLAEQNVPVFCQIDALKINPVIDIEQIRNIRFTGDYPDEVVGVGFHPARAALRTRQSLLGSPLINNIGYIVVVLRQNDKEDTLPEFVNFTLNAQLDYYSGNALGIGRTEFLLREVSDSVWDFERNRQSFFRGQYSVRLISSDPNFATVEIYNGDFVVSTVRLERGKPSREVYVPGSYCQIALRLHYDGFQSADKIARLQVDDDIIDLYTGSRFLNGKCVTRKIEGDVSDGSVEIVCGSQRFTLGIKDKLLVVGDVVNYTMGDKLPWIITEVNEKEKKYNITKYSDGNVVASEIVDSTDVLPIVSDVLFEAEYSGDTKKYFDDAISSYEEVVDSYPSEKEPAVKVANIKDTPTYGERAMERAIELADDFSKDATQARLIQKFIDFYPNADRTSFYTQKLNGLYAKDTSLAGKVIDIDNGFKVIKLKDIISPEKKSEANFVWGGQSFALEQGKSKGFNFGNIVLEEVVDVNRVKITAFCNNTNTNQGGFSNRSLNVGQTDVSPCGQNLRLTSANLEEFARVRVEPITRTTGETNFTVGVGIEKRAIKLNPDKAKERIDELNETIEKWSKISNNLGKVVKGLKGACFATAGVLTVKNFFTGLDGTALARQKAMRGPGGWTEWCKQHLASNNPPDGESYSTLTQCYNEKSSGIGKDVNAYAKAITESNNKIEGIEEKKSSTGFFGGQSINVDESKKKLLVVLSNECSEIPITLDDNSQTNIGALLNNANPDSLSYQRLRDLYFNCLVVKGGGLSTEGVGLGNANNNLNILAEDIKERKRNSQVIDGLGDLFEETDLSGRNIPSYGGEESIKGDYYGGILKPDEIQGVSIQNNTPAQVMTFKGKPYLVLLKRTTGLNYIYAEKGIYKLSKNEAGEYMVDGIVGEELASEIKGRIHVYRKVDSTSYFNKFPPDEARVRYFESEPYKGFPAVVPFNLEEGWYVATRQTLSGFGNIKSFDSSGRPVSFWVCNIMQDKRVGFFSGIGDDKCVQFNMDTGQPLDKFPGLSEQQTRNLVNEARTALNQASQQTGKKKGQTVSILGQTLLVGDSAASLPGTQCQDFMSPEDCLLLFNVCDPVICPSSRCNLGGAYHVSDVIQSGVIGSVLLCLPNIDDGIVIPVCLTGIQAGIDGYLSILEQHQACLQENIETGRTVGICDAITSVYTCEFFWRQAAPVAKTLLPKAVEFLYTGGQGQALGGGEYLTVQTAWDNAQDSAQFFTQDYAANSIEAFRLRSIDEAGTQFCRSFISAKGPKSFETLIEPDSPPQFHAWFSAIPHTTATVPAISQYKVSYNIFAGKDSGVAFSVYLKDPPETSYYTVPTVVVASDFIPRGESASESRDFTAPAGYQQLCVSINGKEECGFKQVSSSFAVNFVRDGFIEDEITREDITSERECISGRINPAALLNPNIQEAAQEAIDPAIYNRGVTRICATDNPGEGTEPERFVLVGNCGDPKIQCWLDKASVDKALTVNNIGAKQETLDELEAIQKGLLGEEGKLEGFDDDEDARQILTQLESELGNVNEGNIELKIKDINRALGRAFWNYQRARLILLRGDFYREVAKVLLAKGAPKVEVGETSSASNEPSAPDSTGEDQQPSFATFSLGYTSDRIKINYQSSASIQPDDTGLYVSFLNEEKTILKNFLVYKPEGEDAKVVADLIRDENVYTIKITTDPDLPILDGAFTLSELENAKFVSDEGGTFYLEI